MTVSGPHTRINLLIKLPSRGRPDQLLDVVRAMNMAHGSSGYNIHWLFSIDTDDKSMDGREREIKVIPCGTCDVERGLSTSKIHAINRDINECAYPWDIIVVASDDMWPVQEGWDTIIREAMQTHFPDTDGMLWFPDGHQKRISTMPIMGRKYYNRFRKVYHESYRSFFCDDEQTEIAQAHGKMVYIDRQLFDHRHPANSKSGKVDQTYLRANADWNADKLNYQRRRLAGFPQ